MRALIPIIAIAVAAVIFSALQWAFGTLYLALSIAQVQP